MLRIVNKIYREQFGTSIGYNKAAG